MRAMTFFKAAYRGILLFLIKMAAQLFLPQPPRDIFPDRIGRILVYADMGIGNMILFTPTLQAIRNQFPKSRITLLVKNSGCEQVVECGSLVDDVLRIEYSLVEVLRLGSVIRKKKFNLLVSSFLSSSKYLTLLTLISRIPTRIGHCQSEDWPSPLDFLYNIQVKMNPGTHEVERHLRLVEPLHCSVTDYPIQVCLAEEDREFADKFFADHCPSGVRMLGVSAGTGLVQSWKQWDLKKLAEVCDRSMEEYGVGILLLGSSDLLPEQDQLISLMNHSPVSCVGKTTVRQAAALIGKCDLMLASDTGLMHMGDAVGTSTIGIFGPTDPRRTGLWGKGNSIVRKEITCSPCYTMKDLSALSAQQCPHHDCLNSISPSDVILEIGRYLKK